jgi:hypothetical protein
MEIVFGGEEAFFSSLRAQHGSAPILNLEQGHSVPGWGRMIFYVANVDVFWEYLRGKGLNPERPRDASMTRHLRVLQQGTRKWLSVEAPGNQNGEDHGDL